MPVSLARTRLAISAAMVGVALVGCGAGARGQRCGFADVCRGELECVHGGPENMGTCERRCDGDADCGDGLRCQLHPPPDALHGVCVPRTEVENSRGRPRTAVPSSLGA